MCLGESKITFLITDSLDSLRRKKLKSENGFFSVPAIVNLHDRTAKQLCATNVTGFLLASFVVTFT